jgi:NitT/TauT family transport system ATP-binding protein
MDATPPPPNAPSADSIASGASPVSVADGPIIEARQIEKYYAQPDGGRIEVIVPTDLSIYPGQIVALLGPSGCGKSTLLRMLTGLAPASAGEVLWHGRPLDGQVPNVGIVFQSFALFPWQTVLENVEAPLEARGVDAGERRERAVKTLDSVGLDGFESAYPKELSGGMKQRVGFARALVIQPEVLFMDEPFSALDVLTAETLRGELLELWLSHKIPTRAIFLVTHNIEEAVFLSDRIIVLAHNPAHIREDFHVEIPHPRHRKDEAFLDLVDRIYQTLTQPVPADASNPPAGAPAVAAGAAALPARFPMLPHVRPGALAALCELLVEHGDREDLHGLATALSLDIDELLPTVEAGKQLGFLDVVWGAAELTPAGISYAAADILGRKAMFRKAALVRVPLLQHMENALRAKKDHKLPDDFFLDLLEKYFSPEVARAQFEAAVQWGRFSEMFEYDAASGVLTLTEPSESG